MTRKTAPPEGMADLFKDLPIMEPLKRFTRPAFPVWTEHKANFIQRYLKLFIQITRHGTYIDGFAGPQRLGMENAWSARLVLQIRPPLLRHFFLCEANTKSFRALKKCVQEIAKPNGRTIDLYHGDFNQKVGEILASRYINDKQATFCLLDQRMFECHWNTVKSLAAKKKTFKIELFYFFGLGWVKRALAGVTKNRQIVEQWWGRNDYVYLKNKTREEIRDLLIQRLREELGYKYVTPYQIFKREQNNIVMYEMLHATDHDVAPELMNRAYRQAVRSTEKLAEQLSLLGDQ
jgi:three-Cys-motif partner protein